MAKVWKKLQRADSAFEGNVTGTLNGTATATVISNATAGAAKPTTFKQDAIPTALNAGDIWYDTNDSNRQYRATATGDNEIGSGEWIDVSTGKIHVYTKGDVGLGSVDNDSTSTIRSGTTKSDVGLGSVDNDSTSTIRAGTTAANVGLGNVTNVSESTIQTNMTSTHVGLSNVANETRATILGGNLTGTIAGVANATVRSGAASGATANQDSSNTIRAGNITGTIDGTAVGTIKSGAAKGSAAPVTFRQDAIPTSLNAGDMWFDTNDGNKQYRATAAGNTTISSTTWVAVTATKGAIGLGNVDNSSAATIQAGTTKANVGLGSVDNTADSAKPVSTAQATSIATKAPTANPTFTGTVAGVSSTHVGLGDVSNITTSAMRAGVTKANVGLSNVADASIATIMGNNLTGTIGGTANATVKSGAAAGATANQDSTSSIRSGTTKANVGLSAVVNQAVTVVSGKLKFDGTSQTMDADTIDGDSKATVKAAAVSTAETNIIGAAPGALNTLNELAAALNDDASFNSTITTSIATKGKAPMALTAEDTDGDSTYTNDPANEVVGQLGVYSGDQYCVVDI